MKRMKGKKVHGVGWVDGVTETVLVDRRSNEGGIGGAWLW